jgi:2-desacetyl-2-hydroxyethyl bacteriochlorophyllide A dehydrogenase
VLQIVLNQPGSFGATAGPEPTAAAGEALVRVHRIGVCGTDLHAFRGKQPFFSYPRILGHELGVEVIDPGSGNPHLRAGDRCSVEPYLNCGQCIACRRGKPNCCAVLKVLGVHTDGGMRPLLALPARKLHRSETLGYDQLALVETLAIGAHAVERADIQADDFVLVIGAGPIGLSVIQFARLHGRKLAVMDISDARLDFCRRLLQVKTTLKPGAQAADELKAADAGDLPSVIIDATGNPGAMAETFNLAAQGGRIVFVGLFPGEITFNDPNFHRRELTLCGSRNALPQTFATVIAGIESGAIDTTPWITHRFSLDETPARFPSVAADPTVLKAMIEVP